jgi:membrane-bound inhibitor of C-type lysozyme
MKDVKAIVSAAVIVATAAMAGAPRLSAQTSFQSYRCVDGTQFIVGFYPGDKRAHMQIDGHEATLAKRLTVSGARYSGGGVSLRINKVGVATLRHMGRPQTPCDPL